MENTPAPLCPNQGQTDLFLLKTGEGGFNCVRNCRPQLFESLVLHREGHRVNLLLVSTGLIEGFPGPPPHVWVLHASASQARAPNTFWRSELQKIEYH